MIDFDNQGALEIQREVVLLPRIPADWTDEQKAQLVAEEAALVDFMNSFGQIANAGDAETLISRYTDDATWRTARGHSVGKEQIKENYDGYYGPVHWFNYWTNIVVRFVKPFEQAYIAAYHYSLAVTEPDNFAVVSTDFWNLKRIDGEWKIYQRRIDLVNTHGHKLLPA